MLTRLLAGATAHDVANLAQSLLSALAIAKSQGTDLAGTLDLVQDIAADLQRLGRCLEALAHGQADARPIRLDLVCADALTHAAPRADGAAVAGFASPVPPELRVRGTPEALVLTVEALIRHAIAATPPGGDDVAIAVSTPPSPASVVLTVESSSASGPPNVEPLSLEQLPPGRASLNLRGDTEVILAALIARSYGGELRIGGIATASRGLRFALELPRELD